MLAWELLVVCAYQYHISPTNLACTGDLLPTCNGVAFQTECSGTDVSVCVQYNPHPSTLIDDDLFLYSTTPNYALSALQLLKYELIYVTVKLCNFAK